MKNVVKHTLSKVLQNLKLEMNKISKKIVG